MANYGGGWSGPAMQRRPIPAIDVLGQALQSQQEARVPTGGGGRVVDEGNPDAALEAELGRTPGILTPGQQRLSPDASPDEIERFSMQPRDFQVGGRPYQFDPRLQLGQELARERAVRGIDQQAQVSQQALQQRAQDARVERLVAAGYARKEAVRQVFGGPRTVAEEQELVNTRSADQIARDKIIQGEITTRAQQAAAARAALAASLERSRSGDRSATLELRKNQILLQDATRAHAAALKARQSNALGGVDLGDPAMDPADAELNAAVSQHLDDVQSTEAARAGAIAGIKRAGNTGAAGAAGISDNDAAAFLGVRQPAALNDGQAGVEGDPMAGYHAAFKKGKLPNQMGPGQGLRPAPKPLEDHMTGPAAKDPGYRTWLMSKGYDVSTVPRPTGSSAPPPDEEQDELPDDEGAEF